MHRQKGKEGLLFPIFSGLTIRSGFYQPKPLLYENALFTPKWDGNPELHIPSALMGTDDFL